MSQSEAYFSPYLSVILLSPVSLCPIVLDLLKSTVPVNFTFEQRFFQGFEHSFCVSLQGIYHLKNLIFNFQNGKCRIRKHKLFYFYKVNPYLDLNHPGYKHTQSFLFWRISIEFSNVPALWSFQHYCCHNIVQLCQLGMFQAERNQLRLHFSFQTNKLQKNLHYWSIVVIYKIQELR